MELCVLIIEPAYTQQVYHLHVLFLFGTEHRAHHAFLILIGIGKVKIEGDYGSESLATYVHDAIHTGVGQSETTGGEVLQRDIGYGIYR